MLASTSSTKLRAIKETVWGQTPVSGNPQEIRMTGETLDVNQTTDTSKEITGRRQVKDLALMNVGAQGAINGEMSYGTYDDFFQSLMRSTWTGYGPSAAVAGTVSRDAQNDIFTATDAPTGPDALTVLKEGMYVKLAKADGSVLGAGQLTDDGTGTVLKFPLNTFGSIGAASAIISSQKLVIGDTPTSFSIEKEFNTGQFFKYTGMQVSKLDLTLQDGQFVTAAFSFIGSRGTRASATALPGTPVAANSNPVMTGVSSVKDVEIDGVSIKTAWNTWAKGLTISFDNQLEGLTALGELGAIDILSKTVQLTGTLNVYLNDGTVYDDFVNEVRKGFSFVLKDKNGNGYAFVMDRIALTAVPVQTPGLDQSVMMDATFQALEGTVSLNSLTIYKL